jgi:hypothetical protein
MKSCPPVPATSSSWGGTGAITRALFGQRAHFDSLAAVERSPHLAQVLAHRFPGLAVHPVCASRLDTLLKGPLDTISVVSSLPFRSLPQEDRKQIEQAILRLAGTAEPSASSSTAISDACPSPSTAPTRCNGPGAGRSSATCRPLRCGCSPPQPMSP